ncbi:MAG: transketolase family protein, partial [Symbiobacteriaceae bacterium]|nr:transketolase family protein [Symbiobacteriaceae bacterium]
MSNPVATRTAYGEALMALAEKEPRLVVLDADLTKSTMTANFAQSYPQRFFNIGIAEADLMGIAAGLSTTGLIPFASSFAIFATGRAYDQIRNTIAMGRLNVKIAATHAGLSVGEDGASHQALEDIGLMRGLPGMTIIVPADGEETYQAVHLAAAYNGPVYLRLGRPVVPQIHQDDFQLAWGKAQVMREGNAATVCATGHMTALALQAAADLSARGIEIEVIHVPFIKPLDGETIINSVRKT